MGSTLAMLGGVVWLAPGIGHAETTADGTTEASDEEAPLLATMIAENDEDNADMMFREIETEDGREKAQVRIERDDEVVKVEVERERPPLPPPVPERSSEGGVRIKIGGFFDGFGWGRSWGYVDIDVGDLDAEMGALEEELERELGGMFEPGFPFGHSSRDEDRASHRVERALERAERQRERASRARERALERAERARDRAERARERASEARERATEAREHATEAYVHASTLYSL